MQGRKRDIRPVLRELFAFAMSPREWLAMTHTVGMAIWWSIAYSRRRAREPEPQFYWRRGQLREDMSRYVTGDGYAFLPSPDGDLQRIKLSDRALADLSRTGRLSFNTLVYEAMRASDT